MADVSPVWLIFLILSTFVFGVIGVLKRSVVYCLWTELTLTLLTPYVGILWFKSLLIAMVFVYCYIGYKIVEQREEEEKAAQLAQIRPKQVDY
jgi:hypothetical protein